MRNKYGSIALILIMLIPIVSLVKRYQGSKDPINSLGMFAIVAASVLIFAIFGFIEWWARFRDPLRKCPICKKMLNGDYEIERTSPRDAKVTCKKCGNTYNVRR